MFCYFSVGCANYSWHAGRCLQGNARLPSRYETRLVQTHGRCRGHVCRSPSSGTLITLHDEDRIPSWISAHISRVLRNCGDIYGLAWTKLFIVANCLLLKLWPRFFTIYYLYNTQNVTLDFHVFCHMGINIVGELKETRKTFLYFLSNYRV